MAERKPKYEPDPTVYSELNRRLERVPLSNDQKERVEVIGQIARKLMYTIAQETPQCREQSLAYTALEECVYRSTAAIACRERRD